MLVTAVYFALLASGNRQLDGAILTTQSVLAFLRFVMALSMTVMESMMKRDPSLSKSAQIIWSVGSRNDTSLGEEQQLGAPLLMLAPPMESELLEQLPGSSEDREAVAAEPEQESPRMLLSVQSDIELLDVEDGVEPGSHYDEDVLTALQPTELVLDPFFLDANRYSAPEDFLHSYPI